MTDGTEKCNPKIEENQREDRRAFRKFIVLLLAAMVVGGITGAFSTMAAKEQADIGAGITAGLQKIAPYANLVIAAALAVWMTGMLRGGRAEYRRWDGEEEQLIEKIERKLGIGVIVTNVALIAGFFFFAAGMKSTGIDSGWEEEIPWVKIALIGYGKMGKEIEKVARSRGHEIVCIIDINNQDDFESEAFKSADVAIEFTNPMVAYSNYMKAFKAGVKLVSGSTGWMTEHGEEIKKLCTEGGQTLFWSSNFSLGVSIFSALNKYLAKIMNQFPAYDVTMSETHHIHKLDAPSGTAITLAEGILEKIDRKDKWVKGTFLAPDGTISGTNDCAPNELPISSIREGEVFGLHTIRYESDVDTISITHDAKSRGGFVLGAVLAAEYTATHEGFLGMSDLFPFLND